MLFRSIRRIHCPPIIYNAIKTKNGINSEFPNANNGNWGGGKFLPNVLIRSRRMTWRYVIRKHLSAHSKIETTYASRIHRVPMPQVSYR